MARNIWSRDLLFQTGTSDSNSAFFEKVGAKLIILI